MTFWLEIQLGRSQSLLDRSCINLGFAGGLFVEQHRRQTRRQQSFLSFCLFFVFYSFEEGIRLAV
jgi:hypothetical protein